MREEGVTWTEEAAATRVWWKTVNPNQRSCWQTSILLRHLIFFLCRPEHLRAFCKERAISIFLEMSRLFSICRERDLSKHLWWCLFAHLFFPAGLQFPLLHAAFRVCDIWQLYSFTPAEFYSNIRWYFNLMGMFKILEVFFPRLLHWHCHAHVYPVYLAMYKLFLFLHVYADDMLWLHVLIRDWNNKTTFFVFLSFLERTTLC